MAKIIFCFIGVAILLVQCVSLGQLIKNRQQRSMPLSQANCTELGMIYARKDCLNCRPTCGYPQGYPECNLETCDMECVCPEGHTRDPHDLYSPKCIPLAKCPKCPLNEVYDLNSRRCGSCEPTCETPEKNQPCNALGCGFISRTCADGLVRNRKNDKCVTLKNCPSRESVSDFPKLLRRPV